jgi:glycosyltransferase involved in cell wall biosynthesis
MEWLPDLPAPLRASPRRHPTTWQIALLTELQKDPLVHVHVICLRRRIERNFHFERNGTVFHVLKVPTWLRPLSGFWVDTVLIKRICSSIKPDVIHAWGSEKGAPLIASRLGYPYVATIQGLLNWYQKIIPLTIYERFVEKLERLSLPRAPVITGESTFTVQYLRRQYPHLDVRHVEHVPGWLFHQVRRRPQTDPVHFISVCTLDYRKGLDLLFKALDQLTPQLHFKLTLISSSTPDQLETLRSTVSDACWQRIRFKHNLTSQDVAGELETATMMLMPTRADTGPMAVKEAALAGVPVVASNVGGIPDYILPGKNGLLFPVNDVSEFVRAIKSACEHPLFGKGLVEADTLARLRDYLSPSTAANRLMEAYEAARQSRACHPVVFHSLGMRNELRLPGTPSPSATMPRITLASLDLFHVINQAQYLQRVGALRDYYSTRLRPNMEKIQPELAHSFYPAHYALRVWQMYLQSLTGNRGYLQVCRLFDYWLRSVIRWDTDLLAILSGVGLKTFRAAQRRGIVTVVECGSTHTDFQHPIVLEEFKRNGISTPLFPKAYRNRVRAEFELADYIQLPSDFVIRTFVENGMDPKKLLLAPYGANLEVFKPSIQPSENQPFRVICPSGINLRKGARVLSEAWRKLNWRDAELVWIGSITKETEHLFKPPLPGLRLEHGRPHPQLAELYRSCDVFVLPSFEEGFARVLLEAAASGLPLIATPNTGVENFFTPGAPEGWLIPANNVDALCEALIEAKSDRGKTFLLGQRAAKRSQVGFSWDDYGRRVLANYKKALGR